MFGGVDGLSWEMWKENGGCGSGGLNGVGQWEKMGHQHPKAEVSCVLLTPAIRGLLLPCTSEAPSKD